MSARMTRVAATALALLIIALIHTNVWPQSSLTVERIYGKPSIYEKLPTAIRWVGDSSRVSYLTGGGSYHGGDEGETMPQALVIRAVPSGEVSVALVVDTVTVPDDLAKTDEEEDKFAIASYRWDAGGERILFTFRGELFTFEPESGEVRRRTHTDGDENDPDFSPDGRRIAYSRDNDLYILDIESNEETRLTATGSDSVYNGTLDWVYMEELFTRGDVKAFWWSPDGERIAFLEIREHPVPRFPLVDYVPIHATYELQHYPKAGDPNPIVRVGIVEVESGEIVWADMDTGDDSYIARVYWLGDGRGVAIEKLNRNQDQLDVLFADASTGELELALEEDSDTWVNVTYLRHYLESDRQFIWGSERDGHSHLYLYNLDGSLIRQLTSGAWEVFSLDGVDEENGRVYFTANEKSVLERHLYSVDMNGENLRRITEDEGTHEATLSPDHRYYVDRFSSHRRPVRVTICSIDGEELFAIGDQVGEAFEALEWPVQEYFTIESGGREYQCMMFKPSDFDPTRRYPVIVYTYGGPGAQVVRKSWSRHHLWHAMMAERGFIVFAMDNRGAAGYGKAWEDPLLREMGRVELEDQIAGVQYLKTLPYVDADNIGMWGWSYGGYMTLMALFKHGDVFKAGTSVAPVSDWRSYDTIYTERYLKRPQDNEDGYHTSSPIHFVDDFDGRLLLMHGDADDNVHFQNTVRMTQELIRAGKDFDLMMYPQKKHGITGTAERVFLYNKMMRFFERHLLEDADSPIHP